MPTTEPALTAAGATRLVRNRLGDIGKADVLAVTSERVRFGPLSGHIRTTVETQVWHNLNDLDDMVRAVRFTPGYVDHTVEGTIITFTFR